MKIIPINNYKQPYQSTSFKSAPQLSAILSSSPTKTSVAPLSQAIFKQYLDALKLPKINFTFEELKKLFAIENNEEFLEAGFNYLLKKLNISDKIAPQLTYADVNSDWSFGYDRCSNEVLVNTLYDLPSKEQILVLLRHELQHFIQNIDLYRQEKIKKSHLNHLVEIYFKEYEHQLQETLKKSPEEWNDDKKRTKKLSTYKRYLDEGNLVAFNKKLLSEKEKIRKSLKNFQRDIIKTLGTTSTGTRKAKNNERIHQAYVNYGTNKEMNWGKYLTNPSEYDATLAEYLLESELNGTCFIKFLKDKYNKFLSSKSPDNVEIQTELAEILAENPNTDFVLPNCFE